MRTEIADIVLALYLTLAPGLVATATWFGYAASTLRPPGPRGVLSAVFLSYAAWTGALLVGRIFALGIAMDGRPDRTLPPRWPIAFAMTQAGIAAVEICILLPPPLALLAAIMSV